MELKDGVFAVKTARKVIGHWLKKKERLFVNKYPDSFKEKRGCFVTIHKYPTGELRGCIGIVQPAYKLIDALVESAISACNDPRFLPLKKGELSNVTIEVSILSKPEKIDVANPKEYPKKVKIGRHGLIINKGPFSGLLLPQVATELKLDPEEFLNETCIKASLPPGCWLDKDVEIYRFSAQVFTEIQPIGKIVEKC